MFELHPQLQKDCIEVGRFDLSLLLLMNDANYPWFILVPQRQGISEIHELSDGDSRQLMKESCWLSLQASRMFRADKMNIAALGNIVPQLHVHHIVRYVNDPAWPGPVWGAQKAKPYGSDGLKDVLSNLKTIVDGYHL